MKQIRVLLVVDHQIIIDGLKALISSAEDIKVVHEANNGREAIDVLKVLSADVVLMDIDMPVMNGLDASREIKQLENPPKIIILSMHHESGMVKNLIDIGVDGYLVKNSTKEETLAAIKKVVQGKKVFSPDITMSLLKEDNQSNQHYPDIDITERELEILKLIVDGFSNKEIGEKLFISHRTVDTHRTNMMKKMGVSNIAGLITYSIKNKLVN